MSKGIKRNEDAKCRNAGHNLKPYQPDLRFNYCIRCSALESKNWEILRNSDWIGVSYDAQKGSLIPNIFLEGKPDEQT